MQFRAIVDGLESDAKYALLFIHGYNVEFDEAVIRAAQIGVDLKVAGITAMYSWPSRAKPQLYTMDEAAVDACCPHLTEFLDCLVTRTGIERIHVIAHSMGNRSFLRVISGRVQRAARETGVRFGQIFLAAPDVDVELFQQLASAYPGISQRTTLYASARDRALGLSRVVHGAPRAGFTPPITVIDGIDTVHVTNVDLSFLGHSYVAEARDVLNDMHALLIHNAAPARRMGLRRAMTPAGLPYWIIGA